MDEKGMSVEQACALAERFGAEAGWTDPPEYIRQNHAFLICGRWWYKNDAGMVVALE